MGSEINCVQVGFLWAFVLSAIPFMWGKFNWQMIFDDQTHENLFWHCLLSNSHFNGTLLSQVPIDPVHWGTLPIRSAASDGSYLQGGVWRQTADWTCWTNGRTAPFTHTAERQDHTQGTEHECVCLNSVSVEMSTRKEWILSCCHRQWPQFLVVIMQHKKLNVEGGGISKDFRKGQKQGDLEIWDPVDQVLVEGSEGYGSRCLRHHKHLLNCNSSCRGPVY